MTELEQVLREATKKVFNEYRKKLGQTAISASMTFDVVKEGSKYLCVLNLEDYWKFIEDGRKAGSKQPPTSAILRWIKVKSIEPRQANMKPEAIAFVIARHIGRNGIKARPYLQESVSLFDEYKDRIRTALQNDINNGTI